MSTSLRRRAFLLGTGAMLTSLTGCGGCRGREYPGAFTSPEEGELLLVQAAQREQHIAALLAAPLEIPSRVKTPSRPVEVLKQFPELRTLQRLTHRLHPVPADDLKPTESNLGGALVWGSSEPPPMCEEHRLPYQQILLLNADDAPSQLKFPQGKDVLHLLWCARPHGAQGLPKPHLAWHKTGDLAPSSAEKFEQYTRSHWRPVPCRLRPEAVLEFPDWNTAKVTPFRDKLLAWKPPGGGDPIEYYRTHLSAAPGCKVGGYPRWASETAVSASCGTCRRGMDYLLSLDSREWDTPSWNAPADDALRTAWGKLDGVAGLRFDPQPRMHLFICRRCVSQPIALING